jgi:hypothetical protein
MALGINTESSGSGDFLPLLSFDARAGRLFKTVRKETSSGWESSKVDITMSQPAFAIDFRSIEIGWAKFAAGMAPVWAMAPLGSPMPERPAGTVNRNGKDMPAFSQTVRMKCCGQALDGVREFSASSRAVLGEIDRLHSIYEAAPEAKAGQIPVVKLVGSTAIVSTGKGQSSTNYAPSFDVVAWVDRPADLGAATVPLPVGGTAPAQTAAPAAPAVLEAAEPQVSTRPNGMPF